MKYMVTNLIAVGCISLSITLTACADRNLDDIVSGSEHVLEEEATGLEIGLTPLVRDHMVIQQGKPFTFWGDGQSGTQFTIRPDWTSTPIHVTVDDQGKWRATTAVPTVQRGDFTAHEIVLADTTGKELRRITDVLIGEVWLCSGQSNMNMTMQPDLPWHEGVLDYEAEIAAASHPGLRLFKVRAAFYDTPTDHYEGSWQVCTSQSVATFSGVAYYMGKSLMERLEIPVGVVLASLGSTSCQAFTSKEVLVNNPELKEKYWDTDSLGMSDYIRPSRLYNGTIHPLRHLSIKGFAWYQGESNAGLEDKSLYTRLCSAMIEGWRSDFDGADLPFYFVQMTPYNWGGNNFFNWNYARFREAQEDILDAVDHTDMAVTMDVGEPAKVHPRNKKAVGTRLARLALFHDYGFSGEVHQGPTYESMQVSGRELTLTFKAGTTGSGLHTSDGRSPQHFWLAGENKYFVLADARIVGNEVVLSSHRIAAPVAVRYAFMNYPLTNFENREGLPAHPFRSDNWDDSTYDKTIIPE